MKKKKEPVRRFSMYIDEDVWHSLERLAAQTRRAVSNEIMHAIERHLESPPTIIEALPNVTVTPPVTRGRGRPIGRVAIAPRTPTE